jgi:hypothetical protein
MPPIYETKDEPKENTKRRSRPSDDNKQQTKLILIKRDHRNPDWGI